MTEKEIKHKASIHLYNIRKEAEQLLDLFNLEQSIMDGINWGDVFPMSVDEWIEELRDKETEIDF